MNTESRREIESSALVVTTFNTAPPDVRSQFEKWVRSLTVADDNESGDDPITGAWSWVEHNNARFASNEPYATFIFLEKSSKNLVGTASFVKDDRDVGRLLHLTDSPHYLGMLGFFQVHRSFRKRGIGRVIASFLDQEVQHYVDHQGSPGDVYLFSTVPHAMDISRRLGFEAQGEVHLAVFNCVETLFKKTYFPSVDLRQRI